MTTTILRIDDGGLASLAVDASGPVSARRALGAELDAAADVLVLGAADGGTGPDRTAAAGFLLALTRRVVVVPVVGGQQHPINVARAVATLALLHDRRIGVAAQDPALLGVLARLWESWPLDSVVADVEAGVYVDASRIRRIVHPSSPIGGPLTVPVAADDTPPTLLVSPGRGAGGGPAAAEPTAADAGDGVELVLDLGSIPLWRRGRPARDGSGPARSARRVLGLGASVPVAEGVPAFDGAGSAEQV
ncbi:hypothetical protein [Mycetocola reblochoni]|uniref:hypothetical protein n=1 Tax=Mycetocola reblochoni TaxID=331618 RepID=UPI003F982163